MYPFLKHLPLKPSERENIQMAIKIKIPNARKNTKFFIPRPSKIYQIQANIYTIWQPCPKSERNIGP
jgi:hypothetical protein